MPKRRSTPRRRSKASGLGLDTLDELVAHLQIGDVRRDAIIIGDGSGGTWEHRGGWAAVLLEQTGNRKLFYGAMNSSTSMVSEIVPYLHAMSWYAHRQGPGRQLLKELRLSGRHPLVHIVTDNDVVRACGNRNGSRVSHAALWAVLEIYETQGYRFQFHHVRRDCIAMNILVDAISKQASRQLRDCYEQTLTRLQRRYPGIPDSATPYDFLP